MTKRNPTPDIAILQDLYSLNHETGRLTRLRRCGTRKAGEFADKNIHHNGYRRVTIDGVQYGAHVIVWVLATGKPPEGEVDHINRDKADNRPKNLRDVTKAENQWNRGPVSRKQIPVKGIYLRNGVYSVLIDANKKRHWIGRFRTICAAIKARKAAEIRFHSITAPTAEESGSTG